MARGRAPSMPAAGFCRGAISGGWARFSVYITFWSSSRLAFLPCFSLCERSRAVEHFEADVLIIGAGGAGLRAAIAAAEADPSLTIALVSKVLPMRSHTVAAEGGAAGVIQAH